VVVAIVPPARAVWFDLKSRSEHLLDPGEHDPQRPEDGFIWVDADLPAPEAIEALRASGVLPAEIAIDDQAPGRVGWALGPAHLHLGLVVARLDGDALLLHRYDIVVTEGAVVSVHSDMPTHFDDLRAELGDDFRRFARSHGFLLFEMLDHLANGLGDTVRALGDRIDELRMTAARPGPAGGARDGSELLASLLVLRRLLARTRDLLAEISSRRSPFVPETTQPFLRDIGNRLDGFIADLAFSRDVLDEALRLAEGAAGPQGGEGRPEGATPLEPPLGGDGRPALSFLSLGGFEVHRGGSAVALSGAGGEPERELLAALLSARRPVQRDQLIVWLWPDLPHDRASRALSQAIASLRSNLEPDQPGPGVIVVEGPMHLVVLGPEDSWDVDRLLAEAAATPQAGEGIEELARALEVYDTPFCPEWPHAEWGRTVREDCARALATLRGRLAELLLGAGRIDEAIGHFETLLEGDPESEAAHRGLMRSHAQAGRMPLALRQYHACRSILRQTQGLDPGPQTQALYLSLLAGR
jgi:DNA-binding SARP family transcriptional activator/Mg2+ and Co2+ transporter CorA